MKILVTGSTGFIGSALVPYLEGEGHEIVRLVRRELPGAGAQVLWDSRAGAIDDAGLVGTEAVVHLAGAGIADRRWTKQRKAEIRDSRINGTRLLCQTLATLDPPPRVLACASGSAYYGDRADEVLTEDSTSGSDFLAGVVRDWEASTSEAAEAGIRVVNLRSALILGANGGALPRMLPFFRLGIGGRIGSGRQYVSWISLDDDLRAITHALETDYLQGPVNIVSPGPVTNAEFTKVLGRTLTRPTPFPVPAFALRIIFGEMADTLLVSTRMDSTRLQASGFQCRHADLEGALRAVLAKP